MQVVHGSDNFCDQPRHTVIYLRSSGGHTQCFLANYYTTLFLILYLCCLNSCDLNFVGFLVLYKEMEIALK